ncbi:MAG: AMIN domain-containing protein, partial [Gemmatimonadetes bacterium]|nr:AMIN domain-containing protein [Gemmatimonadota bacterium]
MIGKQVLATLLATLWAVAPTGRVQEVRISPTGDETEIAVITSGDVEVRDFILRDPARLILDVHGAVNELPDGTFEGIGRGGIVRLRSSQFRDEVVRLVFDLARPANYETRETGERYTVRFANPGGTFEPWSSGSVLAGTVAMQDRVPEPTVPGARAPSAPSMSQDAGGLERITVAYDSASMLEVLA